MTDLSVIILSYNTAAVTKKCIEALLAALKGANLSAELIVVDNDSRDGSLKMLESYKTQKPRGVKYSMISNKENLGYSKGNNQGVAASLGRYILFLNSDSYVQNVDFDDLIAYMDQHHDVGVLTVAVTLENLKIDPASHRGFPTIWNSFTYFAKLEKLFGSVPSLNKLFGGYHLTYLPKDSVHEIDSPTGAFYLTRQDIIREVGGFDDVNFFMYGEDLDLSYRIKKLGHKIMYYPHYQVIHLKHTSGLGGANETTKSRTRDYFYNAMRAFYKKHYASQHSGVVNSIVYFFIDLKKKLS